jgi:hypothetical protein
MPIRRGVMAPVLRPPRCTEVVDSLEAAIRSSLIATDADVATMGIMSPRGVMVTVGATTAIGTVVDTRAAKRSKKSRAWLTWALAKIRDAAGQ